MNKTPTSAGDSNIWDDAPQPKKKTPTETTLPPGTTKEQARDFLEANPSQNSVAVARTEDRDFDIEGLMTDFPTAKDLERFVFDETGIVLNLKGRANKMKYQVAMDVLNGSTVDAKFIGHDNPYLDKTDMVPEEPMKELPPRDPGIPPRGELQNEYYSPFVPHSDPEYHAQGRKMHCMFRKYNNGTISYEVIGPIEPRPHGEKIDKFGRSRPEIIKWVDPRTGEQLVQREDGTLTPVGRRLRAMMLTMKYNTSNQWAVYVDREFLSMDQRAAANPWDLSK